MDNHHEELGKAKSGAVELGDSTSSQASGFVPPRHWIGPDELQESYWKDPQVQAKRSDRRAHV